MMMKAKLKPKKLTTPPDPLGIKMARGTNLLQRREVRRNRHLARLQHALPRIRSLQHCARGRPPERINEDGPLRIGLVGGYFVGEVRGGFHAEEVLAEDEVVRVPAEFGAVIVERVHC